MRLHTLVVTAAIAVPSVLAAQLPTTGGGAGPRVGILAGFSSAKLGGSDVESSEGLVDTQRHNGFVAGVSLTAPLAGLPIAIRPELLYTQKGLRGREQYYTVTAPLAAVPDAASPEFAIDLDYLELPVLVQLEVPRTAGLRPALYAGPALGYRVRCRVAATYAGTTESGSCDDQGSEGPRRFDVSGVVGGQLDFALGGQAVGVGVRYTHGFTNVARDADVKNRAFAVYGTIELPVRR